MYSTLSTLELKVLEKMYLKEVEILKYKLISGAFWKDVLKQKNKTMKLALAIHEKLEGNNVFPDNFSTEKI